MTPLRNYNRIDYLKKEAAGFPRLLREIPLPPAGLYLRGDLKKFIKALEEKAAVAVVGTRRASNEGLRLARKFGRELTEQDLIVVSGLALGIDQAAHWGVLDGGGLTVAVFGNGLDEIYPKENEKLADKILQSGGWLVSEFPPGTPSYRDNFLARNRIISGLSRGVLIIEAPLKSGSLVTAKWATEQNREVFVVPGPMRDHNYTGSFRLIRSGAALVTSVQDICEELSLPFTAAGELPLKKIKLAPEQDLVFNSIKSSGRAVTVDKIIAITKLEPQKVNQAIAFLLVNDIIKEDVGKYHL